MNIYKDKYLKYKKKYLNLKYGSGSSYKFNPHAKPYVQKNTVDEETSTVENPVDKETSTVKKPNVPEPKSNAKAKPSLPEPKSNAKAKPSLPESKFNPKAKVFIPKPQYEKDINKLSNELITKSLTDHNIILHDLDDFMLVSLNIAQRQIIDIVNYNGKWKAYTKIHSTYFDNYVSIINNLINDFINDIIDNSEIFNLYQFINFLGTNYNILAITFYNKITRNIEVYNTIKFYDPITGLFEVKIIKPINNYESISSKLVDENLKLSRIILYIENNEQYKNRIKTILKQLFTILDKIEKPIFICLQEISPLDLFIDSFNELKKEKYSILSPKPTVKSNPKLFENLKESYFSHSILIHSKEIKIKTDDFLKESISNLNVAYSKEQIFKNSNRISEYQFTINDKKYNLINIHLYLITNNDNDKFFLDLNDLIKKENDNIIIVGDPNIIIKKLDIEKYTKLLKPNFIKFYTTPNGNTYDMLIEKKI